MQKPPSQPPSLRALCFTCALVAGALRCSSPEPEAAVDPAPDLALAGPRCPVEIAEVAAYQTVKISLGRPEGTAAPRNAELIAGKEALIRVFVAPTAALPVAGVTVRWTLSSAAGEHSQEASAAVTAASRDELPASTFDFAVAAADLDPGARATVEIVAPAACAGLPRTRLPRRGDLELRPRTLGTLRVRIVPLRYQADGSGRLPDTSGTQLEAFREALLAMFPAPAVELSLREPVDTGVALGPNQGWPALLDGLRHLRAQDRPPDDVYYFGLVAPAPGHARYCGSACTTGVSFVPGPRSAAIRVSVGLGFSGRPAVEGLVHELGHAHGRTHAPCGVPRDPDPDFPYPEALIGVWGFDPRGPDHLRAPLATRDIMGYCGPRWVSDYTFRGLTLRSAQVNRTPADQVAARWIGGSTISAEVPRWRTLFVDPAGRARWGWPAEGEAAGPAVPALLLDAAGESRGQVEVSIIELADTDERLLWVPEAAAAAHTLVLAGRPPVILPTPAR